MRFKFTCELDNDTGELGWKDVRVTGEAYGPLAYARALTHDCLEHFSLSELSDEIEAHAAIYWGRFQGGGVVNLQSLGAEWWGICRAMQAGSELRMPPRTQKLDRDVEEDISSLLIHGRKAVRDEIGEGWEEIAREIEKAFRGWFRIGFRKAERRWRRWNYGPAELSHLFDQLETAFQKFLQQHREEMYEGGQMVLNITRNGEIRFRTLSDEVSF